MANFQLFCMPLCPVESICNLRILISHLYEVRARCLAGITIKKYTFLYLNEMLDFSILPRRLLSILNESNASISITPGKCCIL
jgi:hypothetical protein